MIIFQICIVGLNRQAGYATGKDEAITECKACKSSFSAGDNIMGGNYFVYISSAKPD